MLLLHFVIGSDFTFVPTLGYICAKYCHVIISVRDIVKLTKCCQRCCIKEHKDYSFS